MIVIKNKFLIDRFLHLSCWSDSRSVTFMVYTSDPRIRCYESSRCEGITPMEHLDPETEYPGESGFRFSGIEETIYHPLSMIIEIHLYDTTDPNWQDMFHCDDCRRWAESNLIGDRDAVLPEESADASALTVQDHQRFHGETVEADGLLSSVTAIQDYYRKGIVSPICTAKAA